MVYGRNVRDRQLTFLHSGKLWQDALVLLDRESGTLWSQATGGALLGPEVGRELTSIPSELSTWGAWRRQHPDTLVLPSPHPRRRLKMRLYPRTNLMLGILGSDNPDPRLPGKTRVAGFTHGSDAIAVPLPRDDVVVAARLRVGEHFILLRHEGGEGPTRAWRSTGPPDWHPRQQIAVTTMYWFVWAALHPESRIVEAAGAP